MPIPLFVVTAPRSGSTLLVSALDTHPRVAMTMEAAWVPFLRKASLLASTPALETIDDGEEFRAAGILPHKYVSAFQAAFSRIIHPFVAEFYRRVAGEHDYYGDKITSHKDLSFAIEYFPGAKFVELVRDFRDVIVSSYAFENKQPTAWQNSSFESRVQHLDRFFSATATKLDGLDRLLVRYEDLVSDCPRTMSRLFGFLGFDVTSEMETFLSGPANELFATQGTSTSPGASIGRWRQEMTSEQATRATHALADHLRRFGYPADTACE